MFNYNKVLDELICEKERIEAKPIYKRYLETPNDFDIVNSVTIKRYKEICANINVLISPVDIYFKKRFADISNVSFDIDSMLMKKCMVKFDDGVLIRNFLGSLINAYSDDSLPLDVKENVRLLFYNFSMKRDSNYISNFIYYLYLLFNKNIDGLAACMKIKTYILADLISERREISYKNFEFLANGLTDLVKNSDSVVRHQVGEFIDYLKSNLKIGAQKGINNKKRIRKITSKEERVLKSVDTIDEKYDELVEYVKSNPGATIDMQFKFKDNATFETWRRLILEYIKMGLNDSVVDEKLFKLAYVIYPDVDSDLDYGTCLSRLLFSLGLSIYNCFSDVKIPQSVLIQICNNKILPNNQVYNLLYFFFDNLEANSKLNKYQKYFLEEAKQKLDKLKEENKVVENTDVNSFIVYDDIALYEQDVLCYFDKDEAEEVKRSNIDWYIKCITLMYIYKNFGRIPTRNEFFYDGSFAHKWHCSQVRFINNHDLRVILSKEQVDMFNVIEQFKCHVGDSRRHVGDIIKFFRTNFEFCTSELKKHLEENNFSISKNFYIGKFKAVDIWVYMLSLLKTKCNDYVAEEIAIMKDLRNMRLLDRKSKNQNKCVGDINFGLALSKFLESMNMTMNDFATLCGMSYPGVALLARNSSLPREETLNKINDAISKINRRKLRKDQVADLDEFKKVLLQVDVTRSKRKNIFRTDALFEKNDGDNMLPVDSIVAVRESNPEWYKEFSDLLELATKDYSTDLFSSVWYQNAIRDYYHKKLDDNQEKMVVYLVQLLKMRKLYVKHELFSKKLDLLLQFIDEQNRLPVAGELIYQGEDLSVLYVTVLRVYTASSKKVRYWTREDYSKVGLIVQKVHLNNFYKEKTPDHIDGDNYYIGNKLLLLKYAMNLFIGEFIKVLKWPEIDYRCYVRYFCNDKALPKELVELLKTFIINVNMTNMREDQKAIINMLAEELGCEKKREINQIKALISSNKE